MQFKLQELFIKVFILSLKCYIVCYPHFSACRLSNFLFTSKAPVIIMFVMQV